SRGTAWALPSSAKGYRCLSRARWRSDRPSRPAAPGGMLVLPHGGAMGLIESWKKGWSFMKAAFAMARKDRKLLAPSVYQVLLTILYFVGWVAALVAIHPQWGDRTWTVVGVIAVFGSFLIFYFFCGMTVNMIDAHLKGGRPSLAEGARDAAKNFVAIVFLALVSTVIDTLARAARDQSSVAGKILAGLIQGIWTMLSFLLLPAIIIEDASFSAAMRRVRQL